MIITATEAQNNLSKYYKIAEKEDVFIEKRGNIILKLTKVEREEYMKMKLEKLHGCFSNSRDKDFDEAKYERLVNKHGSAKTID